MTLVFPSVIGITYESILIIPVCLESNLLKISKESRSKEERGEDDRGMIYEMEI